ncbi:MAG: hypothetical protein M0T70_12005 [Geobacteraceae bacterium]|nr:hypothetical protein [Geobacteraceae bacterium]
MGAPLHDGNSIPSGGDFVEVCQSLVRRPLAANGKAEAELRTRAWGRLSPGEWW